jgi:ssDNA-binding Zn-finger/Zn-ribbon topoisomerase 1
MLESVKIRSEIASIGSKDGKTFDIKLEASLESEEIVSMYSLQRNGLVVIEFQPAVSQPSLPGTDKPAEDVPGQASLFGTDGRPRFHVRCEHCNTETTQKVWGENDRQTTYLCDVCGNVNVYAKLTPEADEAEEPADDQGEQEAEAGEIEEPVSCPQCESEMEYVEEDQVWQCVNPECLHTMTGEEVAAMQADGQSDDVDPKPCPKCGAPMDWSEGAQGWVCSAEGCDGFESEPASEGEDESAEPDQSDEPSGNVLPFRPAGAGR